MEQTPTKIVLDTNIFIDFLRDYQPAKDLFARLQHKNILFSAITEVELLAGTANNKPDCRLQLLRLLARFTKVPLDNPLCRRAGDIRRAYGLDVPDAVIAATAQAQNALLLTANTRDYKSVPQLLMEKPY